jgi:lipopolysaccharide transport system ATP-binding protein
MDRWEITRKFDEIVAFAELEKFMDTPVKRYSSGMYMRLAFAVAAHLEPEILLVDEVLAVGDAAFQRKCLGKMEHVSKEGRTVLFVSHNMAAIEQLCDRAVLIDKGQVSHVGPASETVRRYEREAVASGFHPGRPLHVIYDLGTGDSEPSSDFAILRIETLDHQSRPKDAVYTWDRVRFRISYWARREIQAGSAVLTISTLQGIRLLLCSTQPDSAVPMTIRAGYQAVECELESIPFSAGDYMVGAGLAIPNKEWLCGEIHMGRLVVHPRNVYESGMAPEASRSILAVPHIWHVEKY